ncbi:hypothetical protein N473_07370 [Pseudoalteromonas luteoviolacea CPMOR-1]|uniref:Uncharacterized protein n=1 Tax=Pseudoalteromonas luteoviolacea CPMOR-1 TaxID=1365248 RepID=A0A162BTI5_9GAMM|nr:hypothetical protein [Pseudoalteromonas luteoviolacea]KZN68237.1 hypothetical protein N473_07370 [Pseudoalteromonas luteoviolacea CPMOR-1]
MSIVLGENQDGLNAGMTIFTELTLQVGTAAASEDNSEQTDGGKVGFLFNMAITPGAFCVEEQKNKSIHLEETNYE